MSKLVNCKTCEKEVSKSAKKCPHCGAKLKMGFFMKLIILFFGFIGSFGNFKSKPILQWLKRPKLPKRHPHPYEVDYLQY